MLKKPLLVVLTLVLMFSAFATSFAQEDAEPIRIAAIFDLTGATRDVGTFYASGQRAYIDWLNANGGIDGRPIELIWEDYAYDVATAENLYAQFVGEGVVAFQGWGTGDTEALRTRIAEDQIPFMSASYSDALNDPAGEAPYNFLAGTTYSDQLVILLQYMLDEWTAAGNAAEDMHVAFFHNDSPFGTSPLGDGEAFAEENGVSSVRVAMPRGATDFTAELENADAELEGITHIIVQNVSSPAALLFKNARDLGFEDVQFGCLNWCADEFMITLAEDASEGAVGALPFAPVSDEIEGHAEPRAWLEQSGEYESLEAATLHYSQGWWTMALMVEGIRRTLEAGQELTGPNVKAALETLEDFDTQGITAPITFTSEDHRGNRALSIYRVEDGVWVPASDVIDLRAEDAE